MESIIFWLIPNVKLPYFFGVMDINEGVGMSDNNLCDDDHCPDYLKNDFPNHEWIYTMAPGQFNLTSNEILKSMAKIKRTRNIVPKTNNQNVQSHVAKLKTDRKEELVRRLRVRELTTITNQELRSQDSCPAYMQKTAPDYVDRAIANILRLNLSSASSACKSEPAEPSFARPRSGKPTASRVIKYQTGIDPSRIVRSHTPNILRVEQRIRRYRKALSGEMDDEGEGSLGGGVYDMGGGRPTRPGTAPPTRGHFRRLPSDKEKDKDICEGPPSTETDGVVEVTAEDPLSSPSMSSPSHNMTSTRENAEQRVKLYLSLISCGIFFKRMTDSVQQHNWEVSFLHRDKGTRHNMALLRRIQRRARIALQIHRARRIHHSSTVIFRFYHAIVRHIVERKKHQSAPILVMFLRRMRPRILSLVSKLTTAVKKIQRLVRCFLVCTVARTLALYRCWHRSRRKSVQMKVYEAMPNMTKRQNLAFRSVLKEYRIKHRMRSKRLQSLLEGTEQAFENVNVIQVKSFLKKYAPVPYAPPDKCTSHNNHNSSSAAPHRRNSSRRSSIASNGSFYRAIQAATTNGTSGVSAATIGTTSPRRNRRLSSFSNPFGGTSPGTSGMIQTEAVEAMLAISAANKVVDRLDFDPIAIPQITVPVTDRSGKQISVMILYASPTLQVELEDALDGYTSGKRGGQGEDVVEHKQRGKGKGKGYRPPSAMASESSQSSSDRASVSSDVIGDGGGAGGGGTGGTFPSSTAKNVLPLEIGRKIGKELKYPKQFKKKTERQMMSADALQLDLHNYFYTQSKYLASQGLTGDLSPTSMKRYDQHRQKRISAINK
eukprot:gene4308-8568_t